MIIYPYGTHNDLYRFRNYEDMMSWLEKNEKVSNKLYKARKIMDYTGVVFLVLLLLFIWQLYRGPVAVPFLKPYIIKALNHDDSEYQVTVDAVNLELVRSIQPIKIIANNVVYKKMTALSSSMRPKLPSLSVSARCCAALLHRARRNQRPVGLSVYHLRHRAG